MLNDKKIENEKVQELLEEIQDFLRWVAGQ
jgi:hypothetical protein